MRARLTGFAAVGLLACGSSLTAPAAADDVDHARAARAFAQARAEIDAGNCKSAIPKLQESLAFEPSVGAHLSLADCFEQFDLLSAWGELKWAGHLAIEKGDDRASVAARRAQALEPKLPLLRIVLPPELRALPGLEVRLDGNVVPSFLYADGVVATTFGAHDVQVLSPRASPWGRRVSVLAPGEPVAVVVSLQGGPAGTAASVHGSNQAPSRALAGADASEPHGDGPGEAHGTSSGARVSPWRITGGVLGGLGVASLGVGVGFGVVARGTNADLNDACNGSKSACRVSSGGARTAIEQTQSSARTAATVSTATLVAGSVLLAGGIALVLATRPERSALAVRVVADPASLGLGLVGRF